MSAFKGNFSYCCICLFECLIKCICCRSNTENSTAVCIELSVFVLSAGMINDCAIDTAVIIKTEHLYTLFV